MKRTISTLLLSILVLEIPANAGIGSKKAMYVGGTAPLTQNVEGTFKADDEKQSVFAYKGGQLAIPHDKVKVLSYGQHAGRRVGATIALGVTTLGIGALPVLFSKKRRHYMTVEYVDVNGKDQAAIFELGKDVTRTTLKTMEVRTGKKVEYEDEEARKAGNK
jgi:hypothetical protein